jgi:PIN domain nuclease of toxin-antitoxin system
MPPEVWIATVLSGSRIQEAPLTHAAAIRSRLLTLPHQDPADRFIAATAIEYNLTLMTADGNLLRSAELVTWAVT